MASHGCAFLTAHTVLVLIPCCYSSRLSYRLSLTSKEIFTAGCSSTAVPGHNISAVPFSSASWCLFHEPRNYFVGRGCSRKLLLLKPLFTPCLSQLPKGIWKCKQREAAVVTMAGLTSNSTRNAWWCHRSWPESCCCFGDSILDKTGTLPTANTATWQCVEFMLIC